MSIATSSDRESAGKMMFSLTAPILIPLSLFGAGILEIGDSDFLSQLIEMGLFLGAVFMLTLGLIARAELHRFTSHVILGGIFCAIAFAPSVINRIIETNHINIHVTLPILRIACVCCWLLFVMNVDTKSSVLWTTLLLTGIIVTGTNVAMWIVQGRPIPFMGLSPHKNVLATIGFCGTFVGIMGIRLHRERPLSLLSSGLLLVMSSIAMYASGGRKALLGTIVAVGTYWAWPFLRSSVWMTSVFFLLVCVGGYLVVPFYLNMEDMPFFWALDDLLVSSQNQDIYTGREVIWPDAVSLISRRPWLGYGQEYLCVIGNFAEREHGVMAHNLSLAVMYQSGITGLLGMTVFFWSVWWCLCRLGQSESARLSAAFMIGSIVTQYFTVTLMQNLYAGLGLWTIIASGIASATTSRSHPGFKGSVRPTYPKPHLVSHSLRGVPADVVEAGTSHPGAGVH